MNHEPHAYLVTGLAYGDEGKGSWVDHLVRKHQIKYVVRFNGGAQAAHHVVTPQAMMHCFAQFGSGTLVAGTCTILSRYMLVDPVKLMREAEALSAKGVQQPLSRIIVSERAPVITPFNLLFNQIQEVARGAGRHGSCGSGIGITQNDVETLGDAALYMRDLASEGLMDKLVFLWRKRALESDQFATSRTKELRETLANVDIDYYEQLYRDFFQRVTVMDEGRLLELIAQNDTVFEGAQGVMLDQSFGTFPHCTRSNCTFKNAQELLAESSHAGPVTRIGLLRAYGTRHGEGPLVGEDPSLDLPACHNGTNQWQGRFRLGWFDAVAARYAVAACGGVDQLAITNVDRLNGLSSARAVVAYDSDDRRFFTDSGDMLLPTSDNLDWLSARTKSLYQVQARFEHLPSLAHWSFPGPYLERLGELIGHPIGAYSDRADHGKTYRT